MGTEAKSIKDTKTNNYSGRIKEVQLGTQNKKYLPGQSKVIEYNKEITSANQTKLQCGELKKEKYETKIFTRVKSKSARTNPKNNRKYKLDKYKRSKDLLKETAKDIEETKTKTTTQDSIRPTYA